jgi:surfactin synthase thioesterase subunit
MTEVTERVAALPPRKRAELLRRLRVRQPTTVDTWIARYRPNPEAELRLFCFPYAGGGASVFRAWSEVLPSNVEVCAVQPPGRETRIGELAFKRMDPLIADLVEAIEPLLDRPFVFYGHSMGALVAFELTRHLRREGKPQPERLLLAAFRAPQLPNPNIKIYHLPDEVLKVVLSKDGTPQRILQNDELMKVMLPTLRADFELCDTYEYRAEAPLGCPISVFGGLEDVRISASDLDGWRAHSEVACSFTRLPGGHFFVHSAQDLLLAAIAEELAAGTAQREESHA